MRVFGWSLIALAVLFAACGKAGPQEKAAGRAPLPAPEPYLRVLNADSNLVQLQIAVRKLAPADGRGPVIWLTGVSHLGETNYFAALQKHLDAQSLVLFEGVGEHPTNRVKGLAAAPKDGSEKGDRSSLQTAMASSLGLVFQLEAIDYSSARFEHSDLSIERLRQILGESKQGGALEAGGPARSFETLLQMMEGGGLLDTLVRAGLQFLGADPKLRAISRLTLIEILAQIQGDPARLGGLPPELKELLNVLIQERNKHVVEQLKGDLKRVGQGGSVAVFYGTGHMPDLEHRLEEELDYRPAGQVWFTAFSVDLQREHISPFEQQFMRDLIRRQLEQLQTPR